MAIITIGTKTKFGKVVQIGYIGERYYWMIDKYKVVSMIPGKVLEEMIETDKNNKGELK